MKIALIGYGKMGKLIEELAVQKGDKVVLKINSKNLNDLTIENLKLADVAIEFTNAEHAAANIIKCINASIPVVCGTTGWLNQLDSVKQICAENNGAFLYASNFSVGVNIFFELNKTLAVLMNHQNDYEVSIEETHHTQKKDAPSGTAITIAEQIIQQIDRKRSWVNQATNNTEQLSIVSHRINAVAGTHKVNYSCDIDDIDIIHTAHNRKGFASGALLAAEFICGKKGFFEMKEVLGL